MQTKGKNGGGLGTRVLLDLFCSLPLFLPPLLPSPTPLSLQGLRVGDTIVEFGSVTSSNFTSLQEIATVVQHSNEVGVADHHGYCCHGYHYAQISPCELCVY